MQSHQTPKPHKEASWVVSMTTSPKDTLLAKWTGCVTHQIHVRTVFSDKQAWRLKLKHRRFKYLLLAFVGYSWGLSKVASTQKKMSLKSSPLCTSFPNMWEQDHLKTAKRLHLAQISQKTPNNMNHMVFYCNARLMLTMRLCGSGSVVSHHMSNEFGAPWVMSLFKSKQHCQKGLCWREIWWEMCSLLIFYRPIMTDVLSATITFIQNTKMQWKKQHMRDFRDLSARQKLHIKII